MRAEEFKGKWGLTQDATAKLLGTTRSTVSHWASIGEHNRSLKEPPTIERTLDILDGIFTLLDSNPAIVEAWNSRGGDRRSRRKNLGKNGG
jgi:predicted transcriptional regulator